MNQKQRKWSYRDYN